MQKLIYHPEASKGLNACTHSILKPRTTENGIELLKRKSINVFINMPCPLKVATRASLEEFVTSFNKESVIPIYSPTLFDGHTKDIEAKLKSAQYEDEIPEIIIASGLHTVFSKEFKERFIDTRIYIPAIPEQAYQKLSTQYKRLVVNDNIGIIGTGFWSLVCDLSVSINVPYPRQWTDLINPIYKGLISVHGYNGKASITSLLLILKERLGEEAISGFGKNIRNIWHFAEILKRIDTNEPRRTPFNLLPNAAAVQMPSKKRGAILEFEEGPILAPMLMYVKASKAEICKPVIQFFFSDVMRRNLHQGDFYLADEMNWKQNFTFPDWNYLMNNDYEQINQTLDAKFREGLGKDVFNF